MLTAKLYQLARAIAFACMLMTAAKASALDRDTPFESIDGGTLSLSDWEGQPILIVNTASMCAFSDQYRALQDLYDTYRDQGLVVIAVPSDDFNQELDDNTAVKDFCELVYGIDMPMTVITSVKGPDAHPFYGSLRESADFVPRWNFNKVLLDQEGELVATFGARVEPVSAEVLQEIENLFDTANR